MKLSTIMSSALFGILCSLSNAHSADILFAEELDSVTPWQEFLRKNPDYVSITDYLTRRELNLTLGLDSFLDDCERVLQRQMVYAEFQEQVLKTKKIAFGSDHRRLWLDTLEKLSISATPQEKLAIQEENNYQLNLSRPELVKDQAHADYKKLPDAWKAFPIVIVDGLEMPTEKLRFLKPRTIQSRFVFI